MNLSYRHALPVLLVFFCITAAAQDSVRTATDTSSLRRDTTRARRNGMSSLFADSAKLTSSDYQLQIEKAYVTLNKIENKSNLGFAITSIAGKLTDSDSALVVLKDNILYNSRALNLRNLQMFRSLLQNMQEDIADHREKLDSAEKRLNGLRTDMKNLISDTVLRQLLRDSVLRQQFTSQLKEMRDVWRSSTRHLRESLAMVNQLQTHNSSNAIATAELLEKTNDLLGTSAARIFSKEYNYLWEPAPDSATAKLKADVERAHLGEQKALRYYFKESVTNRLFLLLIGLLFFAWIFRNIYRLKKMKALDRLKAIDIRFVYPGYIAAAFVTMFIIAPLFDLDAPSVYIESMQFLLIVVLTIICWKKWPRRLFIYWLVMVFLFIAFSFTHHIMVPGFFQRSWLILLNILSVVFGSLFLAGVKEHLQLRGFLRFVIWLHNAMNILAIACNIFGRFSLAQILGNAAIFAFTQAIGLAIFSRIIIEAILLQIETSRAKRGLHTPFEFHPVLKAFRGPVVVLVVLLWAIVFTTNLNIYYSVKELITAIMIRPRHIGSAAFTLGGILLFFMIIWIAHLLQKYVGYFFGDTGSEVDIQNKRQRSRMLIAKLVVLCAGYLIAVAASGLPVDKITIVLGALGVGIGLGLQNIVNNFVSGIILIFDRPLQIGDSIEIGDKAGRVKEIGLRSSTLLTEEGAEIIIPNGDILSEQITNWTLTNNQQRLALPLTITGSKDRDKITLLVKKAISTSALVWQEREPQVLFTGIKENGYTLNAYFWCKDVYQSAEARSEILLSLSDQLAAENMTLG